MTKKDSDHYELTQKEYANFLDWLMEEPKCRELARKILTTIYKLGMFPKKVS